MIQDRGREVNDVLDAGARENYEGVLLVSSDLSEASLGSGARPINLKNAFTSLCQKISKKPTRLAMPEVMVITWSGPP
jgi:hypothetical protein